MVPFLIWMDQKNLSYLRTAKQQTFQQAQWYLFLNRLNYTLTTTQTRVMSSQMLSPASTPLTLHLLTPNE